MNTSSHPQLIRCKSYIFHLSAVTLVRHYEEDGEHRIRISIFEAPTLYFEGFEAERLWDFFRNSATPDVLAGQTQSTEQGQ